MWWWAFIFARHMPQNQQKVISILPHRILNQMVVETFPLDGQYSGGTDDILRLDLNPTLKSAIWMDFWIWLYF